MLIDGAALIKTQLRITEPTLFEVGDGRTTPLMPVRHVPRLDADDLTLSLDGEWKVKRWPFRASEETLAGLKTRDARWERVAQPGKVFYADPEGAAVGHQAANWNRGTLAHLDEQDGAVMRRHVRVPKRWAGKRVMLRFDSIFPAGRVYLNGELLGEHLSALTPIEYDITDRVKPSSQALVAVRLLRRHKFVKMDMVRHACEFAGLAQSACLFALEPCRMDDYQLLPTLDRTLSHGVIGGKVDLRNSSAKSGSASVTASLLDAAGKRVATCTRKLKLAAGKRGTVSVKLTAKNPALWNDEFPNLYTVTRELAFHGQAKQLISTRTGFRRLELTGKGPRLNGAPVKFRGVNHLTFHPEHGMHTPKAWLRQNLMMMKKANVNCIRTHYLGPRDLADLCDELGIYLMQELPIDWGTDYIGDVEWVGPAMQRIMGGILRDRHHVSLMVWCVGNENLPGSAFYVDGDELRDSSALLDTIRGLLPMYTSTAPVRRLFIDESTAVKEWQNGLKRLLNQGELRD